MAWLWLGRRWCALLFLVLCGPPALAQTLALAQARAELRVNGQVLHEDVTLPYAWDRHHRGTQGEARFELSFGLAEVPTEPWGLYLPRLGNAYEVRLNGRVLMRRGDLAQHNGADYAQVPRYVTIPVGALLLDNRIEVHIRTDIGRRGGLSPLFIGPVEQVNPLYQAAYRWRGTGSVLVVGFSLVVGLIAMALWATQTAPDAAGRAQREPLYLYAGLAELFWTVRVGDTLIEDPPLAWPWWGILPVVALGAWGCSMALFCMEVADWRRGPVATWFRRWLGLLMAVSVPVAIWALGFGQPLALTAWYAALGLSFIGFGARFIWHTGRDAPLAHRIVAAAVVLNVAVGLRDLYVFRINPVYGDNSLIRYSSVLFGLTLGYIVISRFRGVSAQARELMDTLTSRIAQRERELNSSYQRLEALAREQERTAERARILRDMHDGVGSHISAAIRQLQSGRARHEDVLQTLRDSLDQLKLTIDAMHLPPGDITALLANLRYRLEPRFQALDIELEWGVDLIDPVPGLQASAMRHLQFVVFEALSNVLQHAHASWLRIEAVREPAGVCLRIVDNGRGFDARAPQRKGLQSMRERASAIGASLHVDSTLGRTVVELRIPVAEPAAG